MSQATPATPLPAPVSAPAPGPDRVAADAARARRRWVIFGGLAFVIVVADQLSKAWVDAGFGLASVRGAGSGFAAPTPILGDFVRIAKSYNDGGLFGLFGSSAPILAAASVVVIGLLVYMQARGGASGSLLQTITLGLLLGGALGNFIDRIRFGFVIDWVDMGIGDLRWYTWNIADAAISFSIVGLILAAFLPGEREAAETGR